MEAKIETDVMISIRPPYTGMIGEGFKLTEFRKKIINQINNPETQIWVYETKNNGGCGRIKYHAYVKEILSTNTYYAYCQLVKQWRKGIDDIKSHCTLEWYLETIGYRNQKYGIVLENITPCDYKLSDFSCNGKQMYRPPQNMCTCELRAEQKT